MYNDWETGDDNKEFRALLVTPPSSGVLVMDEDGSFTFSPVVDGTFTFDYRLYVDGVDRGVATSTFYVGALTATGIEIAGVSYGSALQRQASETRIEGQAQSEIGRANAGRSASDLQARGQQLLGLQSAAASRTQSMGAIAGGFVIAFSEVFVTYAWKKVVLYLVQVDLAPDQLLQLLSTDYKFAVSFSILIIVLLFMPTGIFKGK